jgi:hypothetical protein
VESNAYAADYSWSIRRIRKLKAAGFVEVRSGKGSHLR